MKRLTSDFEKQLAELESSQAATAINMSLAFWRMFTPKPSFKDSRDE